MTPEELAAIRDRARTLFLAPEGRKLTYSESEDRFEEAVDPIVNKDIPALLTEIERLRAEVAEWKATALQRGSLYGRALSRAGTLRERLAYLEFEMEQAKEASK